MNKKTLPYFVIVFSLLLGISAPALFSDGMFMDGLLYATISKNLANGLGSFWYLHLSDTLYPVFHEHPPLAIALQSILFKFFGDSIYIERFYSLFTFLLTGIIIYFIWGQITINKESRIAWLPLLFWVFIPLTTWSCANNMLENTLMVFTSLSIYFILKSNSNKSIYYIFLAGFSLFLAFLTKGFVALFPLSAFFWLWLTRNQTSFKQFIIKTFLLIVFTFLPFILIYFFNKTGFESLIMYINKQVVGSIQNVQTVDSRFFIIFKLVKELLIPIILVIIVFVISYFKKDGKNYYSEYKKEAFFLFLLGLSGVIPIMVSMKQSGFYILATFPMFSMALALLITPYIDDQFAKWINNKKVTRNLQIIGVVLLSSSIVISILQVNRIGRDKTKLHDVYSIINIVPHNTSIDIPKVLYSDWSLHGYFGRNANISLDDNPNVKHDYFMSLTELHDTLNYEKVNINLNKYKLYKLKIKKLGLEK